MTTPTRPQQLAKHFGGQYTGKAELAKHQRQLRTLASGLENVASIFGGPGYVLHTIEPFITADDVAALKAAQALLSRLAKDVEVACPIAERVKAETYRRIDDELKANQIARAQQHLRENTTETLGSACALQARFVGAEGQPFRLYPEGDTLMMDWPKHPVGDAIKTGNQQAMQLALGEFLLMLDEQSRRSHHYVKHAHWQAFRAAQRAAETTHQHPMACA